MASSSRMALDFIVGPDEKASAAAGAAAAAAASSATSDLSNLHSQRDVMSTSIPHSTTLPSLHSLVPRSEAHVIYANPQQRNKRRRATSEQLARLNAAFEQTLFPSTETRNRLARDLGMSSRTVQIWFQNRRQAFRAKERKRSDASSSQPYRSEEGGTAERSNYGSLSPETPSYPMLAPKYARSVSTPNLQEPGMTSPSLSESTTLQSPSSSYSPHKSQ